MVSTLTRLRQVSQDGATCDSVCFAAADLLPHDASRGVDYEYRRSCQPIVEAIVDVVCPWYCAVVIGVQDRERDASTCPWHDRLSTREVVHADGQHFCAALCDLVVVSMQLN